MPVAAQLYTPGGDEAGTPPGDRRFRPDVQGLRAVAIGLVVLFHAGIPGITGGYVGVDVFFVISGFVITGVLLRERTSTGRTSIRHFYGRRARRIIPAATLVIVVTVVAAYHELGPLAGHANAIDGRWAALFLANFHFAASQTNYLASQAPPSALQNYWSLSVEEQFYVVYPTLFLLTAWLARRSSLRATLGVVLALVCVASYSYSIVFTSTNPSAAFFSPFTRAWELALGGLIAVSGPLLRRLPQAWAAFLSWSGLAAIVVASLTLTSASVYPGALVAVPVLGAGLVIGAGAAQPLWGAERLLRLRPFLWLGLISYSLYLWHWPILVIAAQSRGGTTLPVWENVVLLLVATGIAVLTYRLLENPVRHWRFLTSRRWASIVMGLVLIAGTLVVTTYEANRSSAVNFGGIEKVTTGSLCRSEPNVVKQLRAQYEASHAGAQASASPLVQVVVVGDSTVCTLLPGLQAVGPWYGLQFENGAVVGCGVVSGQLPPYYVDGINFSGYTRRCQGEANLAESQAIERYHPRLIVWGSQEEKASVLSRTGQTLTAGSPKWKAEMLRRIDLRVQDFISTGAKVLILRQPPEIHPQNMTQFTTEDEHYEQMNALFEEVAARHPHDVAVINLEAKVCPSGPPCQYVVDGRGATSALDAIRPDGLHYLPRSALWVAASLVPQMVAAQQALS